MTHPPTVSAAARIPLTTSTGFSPRLGPNYLLYVSATGTSESIWKLADGVATELWSGPDARVFGGPAILPDGQRIAFSVRQNGRTLLYVMQADGTNARIVCRFARVAGRSSVGAGRPIDHIGGDRARRAAPLPRPSGRSRSVPLRRASTRSIPSWAPDGRFVVYSGPDIGTTFSLYVPSRPRRPRIRCRR